MGASFKPRFSPGFDEPPIDDRRVARRGLRRAGKRVKDKMQALIKSFGLIRSGQLYNSIKSRVNMRDFTVTTAPSKRREDHRKKERMNHYVAAMLNKWKQWAEGPDWDEIIYLAFVEAIEDAIRKTRRRR